MRLLILVFVIVVIHANVRVDHNALNLGPCGISIDEEAGADGKNEGENDTERHKCDEDEEVKENHSKATEGGKDISACAENREDERVFENLGNRKLEGDKHQIEVLSHKDVDHKQDKREEEEYVEDKKSHVLIIEDSTVDQKEDDADVDHTEENALAEIDFDGVPEISPHKERLALNKRAKVD